MNVLEAVRAQTWRVVIADDQVFDRAEAKAALLRGSTRRYIIVECETAAEVLAAIRETDLTANDPYPTCLVLDYHLADAEAPEVLAQLPSLAGDAGVLALPVVIVTGSDGGPNATELNRSMLRAGAQSYVGKDWLTPASLTRAVEGAVERHAMVRELSQQSRALAEMNEELEHRVAARTAELKTANRGLEERNAELEQFAYVASHDLQEPLRMVSSFLQLLQRRYKGRLDETADEYIGYAVDGAQRMKRLIQDLLAFSRVGMRKRPLQRVDLNRTLNAVLQDLGLTIEETDAQVEVAELPVVRADPTQLRQAFLNLISNAIKFRREDIAPRVEIGAEHANDRWILHVRDNGIGLDAQYHGQVFQIFQRLHAQDQYGGTGIGLAIVKRIAEGHGGEVWFESEPGAGTTFFFSLPDVESD